MITYGGAIGAVGGFNRIAVHNSPGLFRVESGGTTIILLTSEFAAGSGGAAYPKPPGQYASCFYTYMFVEYLLNTGARVVSSHLLGMASDTIALGAGVGVGNCDCNQTAEMRWQFGSYDPSTGLHNNDGVLEVRLNGVVQLSITDIALGLHDEPGWDSISIGPHGTVSTETAFAHTNGGIKSIYVNDQATYGASGSSLIDEDYSSAVDANIWYDLNASNRWHRAAGFDTSPAPKILTADVTRITGNTAFMYSSVSPSPVSSPIPVPLPTPRAAQTPCAPTTQIGNGGKGKAGCNEGGIGGGHQYTGDFGDVPQHDDPDDGETLTGLPGVGLEPWVELVHQDYPSDVKTTYRRAFEELADDDTYEGGRKESGVLSIGVIEHGLGNEQGGFEAATVDIELSDVRDRLFRDLSDDQDIDGDECRIKLASDEAREAHTTPRTLLRGIVQKGELESMLRSRLTVVDWLFSDFGPFGPSRKDPNWTFGDLGSAAPDMTDDTKAQPIPLLYGEKSDEGAVDPLTNVPASKGLLPGFYLGKFDLTGLVSTPPDTDGRTLAEVVALMEGLLAAGTPAVNWQDTLGFDVGTADCQVLIDMGSIPDNYDGLAHVIGYADLDELLAIGTTPAPAATEWGFICTGLGPWFEYTGVYGSDLGGGDPTKTHDRTQLDPASRSDILVPGINWPYSNPYLELTNPDTGRVFWLTGVFVTGPLLDDHLKNVVNLAFNAIGIEETGDGSGLPIMRVEDAKQHRLENHWINQWSSGDYTTTLSFPQFNDGVPMVRSSSFATRQDFFKQQLGGEGLIVSWYSDKQQSNLDIVRQWNTDTDSRIGVNQHGQIVDFGLDETVDPSDWPRLDHVTDVFGLITRTSGEERENVVVGSCDWDPDFEKERAGPFSFTSTSGVSKYKGRIKQGEPINSQILDNTSHFQWVLQRRLARLEFGVTLLEVPGPLDPWANYDVGQGVLFNSEDGPGASGYVDHPFIILRRKPDVVNRLMTFTLWDVRDVLIDTAFTNGLDRLAEESDGSSFLETDDEDLAPLEIR